MSVKKIEYIPTGVCCRKMEIEVVDGVLGDVEFIGGCHGNLQGIAALIKGCSVEHVIERLNGVDCKGRGTSCPDQLAKALSNLE